MQPIHFATSNTVKTLILMLKNKKSVCPDKILAIVLKQCAPSVSTFVSSIIYHCLLVSFRLVECSYSPQLSTFEFLFGRALPIYVPDSLPPVVLAHHGRISPHADWVGRGEPSVLSIILIPSILKLPIPKVKQFSTSATTPSHNFQKQTMDKYLWTRSWESELHYGLCDVMEAGAK